MKDEKKWTFGKILALAVCILLAVKFIFDFSGFWNLFSSIGGTVVSVLSYILVGFVIAYVLDAYIQFMSNKVLKFWKSKPKAKRLVCIVIGYATFAGVLAFFVFTLVPYLKDSVKTLYNELPGLIEHSKTLYSKLLDGTLISLPDAAINSIANALENVFDTVIAYIDAAKISGFLTTTIVMIFNVVMGIMVSVYMLIEKEDILKASNKIVDGLFNKKNALRIKWAGRKINEIFRRYFTGKILQAIIVSILAAVVFSIGRIPYALLFAVVVGVFNMIPYIGPWVGAAPVIIISLVNNFWTGVAATVCVIVIQIIDNWIISPRVLGDQMGISPLTILIGLCIGGKIFGIAGMIVGDVMAALFKVFFYDTYIEALRRKKIRDRATEKALHDAAAEIGANNAEIDLDEDLFGGKPHDEIAEQSAKERAAAQLAGRTAKKRKNKNDSKNRS